MCQLAKCFGWGLDAIQRLITFLLAFWTSCCICIGLIACIGAGVAYGYNYSLAEFIYLKRADVTVFIRRGQFGDIPGDLRPMGRRSGGDEDVLYTNSSVDYQDGRLTPESGSSGLSSAWQKAADTRSYAETLTKYSKEKPNIMKTFPVEEKTWDVNAKVLPLAVTPYSPSRTQSDLGQPRRKFNPEDPMLILPTSPSSNAYYIDKYKQPKAIIESDPRKKTLHGHKKKPVVKIRVGDSAKSVSHSRNDTRYRPNRKSSDDIAADYYNFD